MKSSPKVNREGGKAGETGTHLLYHSSIRLNLQELPLKFAIHFLGLTLQGGHCLLQSEDAIGRLVGFHLQARNLLGKAKALSEGQSMAKISLGARGHGAGGNWFLLQGPKIIIGYPVSFMFSHQLLQRVVFMTMAQPLLHTSANP